jgi:peptidoglycan/LPS O-acetylase OafA/YrhL
VVAYHAGLSAVPGGYVGVDVFFVISGFLITDHLGRELADKGGLAFGTFYARRARRLLPSALLVIAVTVAVSCIVLPPLQAMVVAKDGLANAFYVGNYRYALQATNYLSASGPVSPLLNYWSLGVEEQFYLVWPALLFGASLVWWRTSKRTGVASSPRRRRPPFSPVVVTLTLLGACSFAFSIWLTRANQPWAFFSLPTRAWELAAGGLLALFAPRLRRLPTAAMSLLSWAGIGAIVFSALVFTSSTPFPGTAALVPVAGAAAVVAGGCARPRLGAVWLLGRRPLQVIGGVSYTWYLWHWPALILAPSIVGHPLRVWGNALVCVVALVVAGLTTLLLERPLQRASWLARPRRVLLLTGVLTAAAVVTIVLSTAALPSLTGSGHIAARQLSTQLQRGKGVTQTTIDPVTAAAQSLTSQVQADVTRSVGIQAVPANLTPSLAGAAADEAAPFVDGCFDGFTENSVNPCNYGDVTAPPSKTVVLFGDSHALMWFPAFDNLANQYGWHLIPQAKATCPPIYIPVYSPVLGEWYTGCDQWRAAVVARIQALHPAVVVLGFSREYGIPDDRVVVDGAAWMQGLSSMMTTLRATGAQVVLMGDVPYPQTGLVPNCLSAHLTNATACTMPKQYPYFNSSGVGQEQAAAASAGAGYIDTQPWFCSGNFCAVIVDNLLVYRDDNHLTDTYASWLTPVIGADLEQQTGGVFGTPP